MSTAIEEEKRVEALRVYDIIHSNSKEEFDKITELAAAICEAPIAKINLLDKDTQWTISNYGSEQYERSIAREKTVCQYTIKQKSILEIPNLSKDSRFKDAPYVKGEPYFEYYLGAQLKNPDGYTIGALCVLDFKERHLSDRKKRELEMLAEQVMTSLELRKQNQQLTELNEQKNNLMKILSHDLRSPLSGIIGMSDLLGELVDEDNKEAMEMTSLINQSAKQLNQLIDDILNYTIIESKGFTLNRKETDLHSIVENMRRLYMPSAKLKNIDMAFDVDIGKKVWIDDEKFEQIFGNLLSNAIKFTTKNGKIRSKILEQNDNLILQVSDTGVGMKDEKIQNLFTNENAKGQEGTSGEKSTGLGLNIIKHFTDLHGGSVDVESTIGEGTTFTVRLPLSDENA
ncbi:MAG: GAF domain-containing sensor histidine kinase [Balneolaceae bacterium]|nr:GAF domain-containing sensor histidine kinase [Balneolaceae bacterium]